MRWEQRGLIRVLVESPAKPTISDLIACPTCHARVTETCKTASGHTTTPHGSRLAPRLCGCGELVQPRRRYCNHCRDETDYANRQAGLKRHRARAA